MDVRKKGRGGGDKGIRREIKRRGKKKKRGKAGCGRGGSVEKKIESRKLEEEGVAWVEEGR